MVLLGFQGAVADQRSEVGAGPTITNKKRRIFGWLGWHQTNGMFRGGQVFRASGFRWKIRRTPTSNYK